MTEKRPVGPDKAGGQLDPADPVYERLRSFLSESGDKPEAARDPVDAAMIRHWCDAIGDSNPAYTDPGFAARSVHGGLVAPPPMLQSWVLQGLVPPSERPEPSVLARIVQKLDDEGFTSVVATNSEQEYMRYLRPGDRLSLVNSIETISEMKQTALGTGYFVTALMTYRDEQDEVVGTTRLRILKFRPTAGSAAAASAPPPRWPRPTTNQDNAFFWEGIERGELLIQRCSSCGKLRHPPRPMCPHCQSLEWGTDAACGRGTVYSFVVMHYPPIPPFEYPFVVALIELEEGTRFVSNLIDVDPAEVKIGMPVELCFTKVSEELTLPRFRPAGRAKEAAREPEAAPEKPEGLRPRDRTLRYDEVQVGDEIPPLPVELTPTLIISTAIASRDYQDVHHDHDAAVNRGGKDIFMNILTTNGFVGRYVTDWAGPEALLKKISIRLGAPNYPGDTMVITGRVSAKEECDGEGLVNIEVSGKNAYGDHVVSEVQLGLVKEG